MATKTFMHRIKEENGTFDKGIEVHDTYEAAKASYHAYLGAYAYDNPKFPKVNYVSCMITDISGMVLMQETWIRTDPQPEPEPAAVETAETPE